MIDQFGKVMIYVENPRRIADFWIDTLGFSEIVAQEHEGKQLSVEVAHTPSAGASLVLFDRAVVAQMSPELNLGTPSILFSSKNVAAMREELSASGVTVGDIAEHGGRVTFNFADPEGNYFAVQQLDE